MLKGEIMKHFIENLFARFHASQLLRPIYHLVKMTGLHRLGHIIFDFWERAHPTETMKKDRMQFQKHEKELRDVYRILGDEKSKMVYKNVLMFRITKNRKYLRGMIEKEPYFVKDIIKPESGEVFVDCGAFDGDTLKDYLKFNKYYKKIIMFEPTAVNLDRVKKYVKQKNLKNIHCFQAGVGEKTQTAYFTGSGTADARVAGKGGGNIQIQMFDLDSIKECQDATFIKMDIEGSELPALKGAKEIILRNKPKLAICIYHKAEDYYQIPLYLKKLVPEYKFYVRHHFYSCTDTVLYAVL